uniref:Bm9129, isoform b n=1 Tax=Brugia malayi TaxID=6279 RepID=A0A1I9G4Y9_BRUMA|nr:Bm9129, isoform b [Brugia malayi]
MPRNFRTTVEERKSRLPLATTQNNRYLDTKHKTTTTASPATSSVSRTLPLTSRRGSTQTTTKSSLSTGRRSSTTSAGKPPTGLSADNTNVLISLTARRSSATTVMSRSVSSLNGKVGLMPSQSTDSVTLFKYSQDTKSSEYESEKY